MPTVGDSSKTTPRCKTKVKRFKKCRKTASKTFKAYEQGS